MTVDVVVPALGESITEGTVLSWSVAVGAAVEVDDPLVEVETDKITVEVPSPVSGVVRELVVEEGTDVEVGQVLCRIEAGASASASAPAAQPAPTPEPAPAPAAAPASAGPAPAVMPSVRRIAAETGIDPASVAGSGRRGQVLKSDMLAAAAKPAPAPAAAKPAPAAAASAAPSDGDERRVPMTRLRRRIAERLVDAQRTAAILTTFNEVDMSAIMALRAEYKQAFIDRHGIKLGFMSFFVKASIEALKRFPVLNASIDGDDIVYHQRYHVGVAVSSDRGLVVPVVRDADRLSLAEVEQRIGELGRRARDRQLQISDLTGGTFTISNGGVFGSMLSTPILNPPQSAILGMHNIVRRPWVVGDSVEIRPIMYLALSYDHRLIDGREAVSALVHIKRLLEDPRRILLEI